MRIFIIYQENQLYKLLLTSLVVIAKFEQAASVERDSKIQGRYSDEIKNISDEPLKVSRASSAAGLWRI